MSHERDPGDYLFKFQFFVHELTLLKDFFNIAKPAIAIRFLDFPTLIIEGKVYNISVQDSCSQPAASSSIRARSATSKCTAKTFS